MVARQNLDVARQLDAASAIVAAIVEHAESIGAQTIAASLPHRGEIDLRPTLEALLRRGRRIALPVCGSAGSMHFSPWEPGDRLISNRYGINEPISEPLTPHDIDAVLVPGVAFSPSGDRLGHGVGFYDRWFESATARGARPRRIGVAHDFQVLELPTPEPWDVPMDVVITPARSITVLQRGEPGR